MDRYQELLKKTAVAGQEQLLRFWNELSAAEREELAAQIEAIDFPVMANLIREYVLNKPKTEIPDDLGPAPYFPLVPRDAEQAALYERAVRRGQISRHTANSPPHGQPVRRVCRFAGALSDFAALPVSIYNLFTDLTRFIDNYAAV